MLKTSTSLRYAVPVGKNPLVLNCRCQLMHVVLYNGHKTLVAVEQRNLGVELSEMCNSWTRLIVLLDKYKSRGNEGALPHVAHGVVGQRLQQSNCFFQTGPSTRHAQRQRRTIPTQPRVTLAPSTVLVNGQM